MKIKPRTKKIPFANGFSIHLSNSEVGDILCALDDYHESTIFEDKDEEFQKFISKFGNKLAKAIGV
jgi:hypothetical protein